MLNPNNRTLYTSILTPPTGMVFDRAVATTFSMSPALLLEAPVYLALLSGDSDAQPDPLKILHAIRQFSERITVYVDAGRIQVPDAAKANPVFALLENMIVEAAAPKGGSFHPKVWAIRFKDEVHNTTSMRLAVLSRNLTYDQSWDLSLVLEGHVTEKVQPGNRALITFFESLPKMAVRQREKSVVLNEKSLINDLLHVEWNIPDPFDDLNFYIPGSESHEWHVERSKRMAVISPFCSDKTLDRLCQTSEEPVALLSRAETLDMLTSQTRDRFTSCLHLNEAVDTADGEEQEQERETTIGASGLHAKAFVFETGRAGAVTRLVMGSANATNAALDHCSNVELLVELIGKTKNTGGIEKLLDEDGMGEYLQPHVANDEPVSDAEQQAALDRLDDQRKALASADLHVECVAESEANLWSLVLTGELPLLDQVEDVFAWPITLRDELAVSLSGTQNNRKGIETRLSLRTFSAASLTGLIAFKLTTKVSKGAEGKSVSVSFVLNLPIKGLPEERNGAILNSIINNKDGFLRYLLMLLSDDGKNSLLTTVNRSGAGWMELLAMGDDVPLVEEMSRAYSRSPEKLDELAALIEELSLDNKAVGDAQGAHGPESVVPESFRELWAVFEDARKARNIS